MEYRFVIKCKVCKWTKKTNGIKDELKDLHEVTSCASCRGREFRCPKCGRPAKMLKTGKI